MKKFTFLLVLLLSNIIQAQHNLPLLLEGEEAEAKKDLRLAKSIYKKMLNSTVEEKDTTMAYCCQKLAFIYLGEGKRDSAVYYYNECFDYYKKWNDSWRQRYFLTSIAELYRFYHDYKNEKLYIKRALEGYAEKDDQTILALKKMGLIVLNEGKVDSAKIYFSEAQSIFDSIPKKGMGVSNEFAQLEIKKGNYSKAIDYYIKELSNYKEWRNPDKSPLYIANKNIQIARLFVKIDDFKKAEEYINKSQKIADENGFTGLKRLLLRERGIIYLPSNPDSSIVLFKEYYEKVKGGRSVPSKFSASFFLADAYNKIEDTKNAKIYIEKAKKYVSFNHKPSQLSLYHRISGEYYMQIKDFNNAILHFKNSLKYAKKGKLEKSIIQQLSLLGRAHYENHDYKKSYELTNEARTRNNKLTKSRNQQIVYELETKFQKSERELEIANLNIENNIKDQNISRKNKQLMYGLFGLILFFGLAGTSYLLYRNKKKANQKLEEKNTIIQTALSEKELLLKEIHHRVKNNLQVVSSLLSLQSEYIKDDAAKSAVNDGQNRVRSMTLIHQNLYQENDLTGINVKSYFSKLLNGLFESYNIYGDEITFELNVEDIVVDVDTIVPLGLIANELITNALKYAFPNKKGHIKVSFERAKDVLLFSVTDNGEGFDESILNGQIDSFGYQMIYAFCDKLNSTISVDCNNGTSVNITIPYVKQQHNV